MRKLFKYFENDNLLVMEYLCILFFTFETNAYFFVYKGKLILKVILE